MVLFNLRCRLLDVFSVIFEDVFITVEMIDHAVIFVCVKWLFAFQIAKLFRKLVYIAFESSFSLWIGDRWTDSKILGMTLS